MKPETKAESAAPEHKSETETSGSTPKTDGDNSVPASKVPVSLFISSFSVEKPEYLCLCTRNKLFLF